MDNLSHRVVGLKVLSGREWEQIQLYMYTNMSYSFWNNKSMSLSQNICLSFVWRFLVMYDKGESYLRPCTGRCWISVVTNVPVCLSVQRQDFVIRWLSFSKLDSLFVIQWWKVRGNIKGIKRSKVTVSKSKAVCVCVWGGGGGGDKPFVVKLVAHRTQDPKASVADSVLDAGKAWMGLPLLGDISLGR